MKRKANLNLRNPDFKLNSILCKVYAIEELT